LLPISAPRRRPFILNGNALKKFMAGNARAL
jgi:hypothetical protein